MSNNFKDLVIVIPNYNEETTLSNLVGRLIKNYHNICVIDDFSNDKSVESIKNFPIKVIRNSKRLGYEKTLNKGFQYAREKNFKYIITIDADGQHNIEDIELICSKLKNTNCALVIAQRDKMQRFSEKIFSLITKKICNIDDPLSGLKGINIHKLISDDEIITPFSKSGTSIILHCLIKKLQVEKVNIKTNKRFGRSRYGSVFSSNWKILMSILPFISKYKKYETKKN